MLHGVVLNHLNHITWLHRVAKEYREMNDFYLETLLPLSKTVAFKLHGELDIP